MLQLQVDPEHSEFPSETRPHLTLLFCRLRERWWSPFIYCGRLHCPEADWTAAKDGTIVWELQVWLVSLEISGSDRPSQS